MNDVIEYLIQDFISKYTSMDICGISMHCPYWVNRLKNGIVVLRGFGNGKGSADEIRDELVKRLENLPSGSRFGLTNDSIAKFAKRERIGIDCSGFAYRVLDRLVKLKYSGCNLPDLDKIFVGGIHKTNARTLASEKYAVQIKKIKDYRLGDMIRLWGGKHIVVITKVSEKEILYAHSSSLSTKVQGVHTAIIHIIDPDKSLSEQKWSEKTRIGEDYGKKYFHPENGDGVFRLKVFS